MASGVCFFDSGVAVATIFSESSQFIKPSFPLLVSPFESSHSDVSGGLVADDLSDDLGVDVAGTATGDFLGMNIEIYLLGSMHYTTLIQSKCNATCRPHPWHLPIQYFPPQSQHLHRR